MLTERKMRIKKLQDILKGYVITYVTADTFPALSSIDDDDLVPLALCLKILSQKQKGKINALYLFIYTRGGRAETARRIVDLLDEYANGFHVIVPYRCHSTGTHIALAAKSIITTPLSELSGVLGSPEPISEASIPLFFEPAIHGRYLPPANVLSSHIVAEIPKDKEHTTLLLRLAGFREWYERLSNLTRELVARHGCRDEDRLKIIEFFSRASHTDLISREMAKKVGLNIIDADATLEQAIMSLYDSYAQELCLNSSLSIINGGKMGQPNYLNLLDLPQRVLATEVGLPEKGFTMLSKRLPKLSYIECVEEGYVKIGFCKRADGLCIGSWVPVIEVEEA